VRACACCRPSGSFLLWTLESRITEPSHAGQSGSNDMCIGLLTRDFICVGGQDTKTGLRCGASLLALAVCGVWRFPGEEPRHGVVCGLNVCCEDQVHYLCFGDNVDVCFRMEQVDRCGGVGV
jgi:hypothetical protein